MSKFSVIRAAKNRELRARMLNAGREQYILDAEVRTRLETEFLSRIEKTEGCWSWIGSVDGTGHPIFGFFQHCFSAAKLMIALTSGFFPAGRVPRLCGNKLCVRPEHLEIKTIAAREEWRSINETLDSRTATIEQALRDPDQRAAMQRRFDKFVERLESGHWVWIGGRIKNFPHFTLYGNPILAKRVALGLSLNRLPRKVRETCAMLHCMNPEHLEERHK